MNEIYDELTDCSDGVLDNHYDSLEVDGTGWSENQNNQEKRPEND